jgi:uncharacterized membrane protein YhaH (DUF805 family)
MEWYIKVLKNYAVFEGRASRQEYWMFTLFNILISFAIGFVTGFISAYTKTDQTVLANVYSLAVFIPSIAVAIRRMHDTDRNGWWCIVPIASLIFSIEAGQVGPNKYGPDPKGRQD